MAFITKDDFKAVCDPTTLEVIDQTDNDNLNRAIGYAMEEVAYGAQSATCDDTVRCGSVSFSGVVTEAHRF